MDNETTQLVSRVADLDAFQSAFQAFVDVLCNNHFDYLFPPTLCQTSAHKLFHLLCSVRSIVFVALSVFFRTLL
jgi:hypothetical protein